MQHRIKHVAEYAALRMIAALVNALPYRTALAVGWLNAWVSFGLFVSRRREAEARIRQVFPERSEPQALRKIAWQSWRNMVFNAIEMLRVPHLAPEDLRALCADASGIEAVKAHCARGHGAILAVPHMGNWELAALVCRFEGIPIFSIAARQRNPLTDAYLNRLRSFHGIPVLTRGTSTMKEVLRRLRAGEVLAILPDVRVRQQGITVPFLGGMANLGAGMAMFARHAQVPVIPGAARRCGWTRHCYRAFEPIWPDDRTDKDTDVLRITRLVMQTIEQTIRQTPEQWFWFNRRWVLEPLEENRLLHACLT